jgi:hypothetical protein
MIVVCEKAVPKLKEISPKILDTRRHLKGENGEKARTEEPHQIKGKAKRLPRQ